MAQLASFFVEEEEGVWAAASFKLAGAIKRSADTVELYTAVAGVVIRLDGASETGTITMADGKTHAVRCGSEAPLPTEQVFWVRVGLPPTGVTPHHASLPPIVCVLQGREAWRRLGAQARQQWADRTS